MAGMAMGRHQAAYKNSWQAGMQAAQWHPGLYNPYSSPQPSLIYQAWQQHATGRGRAEGGHLISISHVIIRENTCTRQNNHQSPLNRQRAGVAWQKVAWQQQQLGNPNPSTDNRHGRVVKRSGMACAKGISSLGRTGDGQAGTGPGKAGRPHPL